MIDLLGGGTCNDEGHHFHPSWSYCFFRLLTACEPISRTRNQGYGDKAFIIDHLMKTSLH